MITCADKNRLHIIHRSSMLQSDYIFEVLAYII